MTKRRMLVATLGLVLAGLILAAGPAMNSNATAMTTATKTTAGELNNSSDTFTFSTGSQWKVHVANLSTSGVILYVRWNSATAATTASGWDHELLAGQEVNNPDGKLVDTVAIFTAGNPTYGTHYIVKGWN